MSLQPKSASTLPKVGAGLSLSHLPAFQLGILLWHRWEYPTLTRTTSLRDNKPQHQPPMPNMADAMAAASPKGLLRFPHFLKACMQVMKDQQAFRSVEQPSLMNPEIQKSDFVIGGIIAIILFSIRILLEKSLFRVMFSRFPSNIRRKLSENLFYTLYYSTVFCFYYFVVRPQLDWSVNLLSNSSSVVRSLVYPCPPPMTPAEHHYYAQAAGFYLSASAFLILFDTRRSDYNELLIHHAVTIGLVGVSYAYGYVRAGIVILALHDIGDVFLYLAKFVHYLGMKGLDTALFAVFAVTFYVTRLVMFSRITHAIIFETLQVLVEDPSINNWGMFYDTYLIHYIFFNLFLPTLLVLHCFWFALILRMIYREVFLGAKISDAGDIRSDDEDGDDDDAEEADNGFYDDTKKNT